MSRDLLLLAKKFNENELRIINDPDGPKRRNGTLHLNWFAKALKLIADNKLSFEEICRQCYVPEKTTLNVIADAQGEPKPEVRTSS